VFALAPMIAQVEAATTLTQGGYHDADV
jgi:hypothetical protein